MASRKNKLRMCFLFLILMAILVVATYYYYTGTTVSEWGQGTLITIVDYLPWGY